jgi:hypothetical protein
LGLGRVLARATSVGSVEGISPMATKRQKAKSCDRTPSRDRNRSRYSIQTHPHLAPTRQENPDPETRPSSPQQPSNDPNDLIWIPANLSTTQSRLLTYKKWPHSAVPPLQLAKFGFYHDPDDEYTDAVECFACGTARYGWRSEEQCHAKMLLALHEAECMWADLLRQAQLLTKPCENRPSTPVTPSVRTNNSTPTPITTEQKQAFITEANTHKIPEAQQSSPSATPRPTYASVLKTPIELQQPNDPKCALQPPSSSPKTPTTKQHSSSPCATPTPILTMDNLCVRFHNRPSPFKLRPSQRREPNPQITMAAANANCCSINGPQAIRRDRGRYRPDFTHF